MNNKELAQLLLSEASELLTESSKTEEKYFEALKNKIKAEEKRLSHISDPIKLKEKERDIGRLERDLRSVKDRLKDKKEYENNYKKHNNEWDKNSAKHSKKSIASDFDWAAHENIKNKLRSKINPHTEYEEEKVEYAIDKRNNLHKNINKRVQNESIAVLLTEAALLLND